MKHHSKKRRHNEILHHHSPANNSSSNPQQLKKQHAETRRNLPVFKFKNEICRMVADNEVLLVVAETVCDIHFRRARPLWCPAYYYVSLLLIIIILTTNREVVNQLRFLPIYMNVDCSSANEREPFASHSRGELPPLPWPNELRKKWDACLGLLWDTVCGLMTIRVMVQESCM